MSTDRKPEAPPAIPGLRFAFAIIGAVLLAALVWHSPSLRSSFRDVPYTDLVEAVNAGRIKEAQIDSREIRATFTTPQGDVKGLVSDRIPNLDERALFEAMQAHAVVVTAQQDVEWWGAIVSFLPWLALLLLFGVGSWFTSGMQNRAGAFGASKAKLYDRGIDSPVTFADVAGVDEAKAELVEIVEFLKSPERYRSVGARVPKGVLLVGAPGTGKTLLARAVAGESGVPFFSIAGSEFVEMFVGVGASRVRDLFARAKQHTPCIVFIDELDAVGKSRAGTQGFVANEEREQTLNQLLIELDGFDSGSGLIVVAATNRPEILDRALLRAGRFDRQVTVDRPDRRGREAILKVHTRKVALAPDVDLAVVSQRTPGMVGADLANLVNEAALASIRFGKKTIDSAAFDEAIDRIQLGLKKAGRVMTDAERRRVAYHEAGHALVALSLDHVDPVHRVSIIPRSIGVLGTTLQLPVDDRVVATERELLDRLCVLFGGRAAERIACEDVSTGAADDLDRATELARQMICRFGMSQALGPRTFEAGFELGPPPSWSEETRRQIDAELKRMLEEAQSRARRLLEASRPVLEAITKELLVHDTLQRSDLERLLDRRRAAA